MKDTERKNDEETGVKGKGERNRKPKRQRDLEKTPHNYTHK